MTESVLRLLLVDDNVDFLDGLSLLLDDHALSVVRAAHSAAEAIDAVRELRPDVVLMDLQMPVMSGIEAIARIRHDPFAPPIIALTTFDDDRLVFEALRAGAVSYLLKDAERDTIVEAVKRAAVGESMIEPRVARKVVEEFARLAELNPSPLEREPVGLSRRETSVLQLLSRGASNKEIAHALNIENGTVRNHLSSVYRKLGVTDRLQAVVEARRLGIG